MKKKIFLISIIATILFTIGFCNTSKADYMTNTELKYAIEDYFLSDIEMYEIVSKNNYTEYGSDFGSKIKYDLKNSKFYVLNNKDAVVSEIEYNMYPNWYNNTRGNQIEFYIKAYPKNMEEEYSEKAIYEFYSRRCYLCCAISLGVNPSLAYTHYRQVRNTIEENSQIFGVSLNAIKGDVHYGQHHLFMYLHNMENENNITVNKNLSYYNLKFVGHKYQPGSQDFKLSNIKLSAGNQEFTGREITPSVSVTYSNQTLKEGKDYKLSYKNNIEIGKATVTITGRMIYKGSITKSFIIYPQAPTNLRATKQDKNSITIGWNKPESGATAYRIYMYNSSEKKWEYKQTTDKTSGTVFGLKPSTGYIFKVCAYVKVDNKLYKGNYTANLTTATAPAIPTIKSIAKTGSSTKKQLKVTWSKSENASGYEIAMYTSKTKSWSKIDIKYASNISKVYSNLAKDKITYKFKVRAYKTVNGKKVYSQYSAIKSIYY